MLRRITARSCRYFLRGAFIISTNAINRVIDISLLNYLSTYDNPRDRLVVDCLGPIFSISHNQTMNNQNIIKLFILSLNYSIRGFGVLGRSEELV